MEEDSVRSRLPPELGSVLNVEHYALWVHVVAGIVWTGGTGFLALVVFPAGRFAMPLAERALYFRRLDRAFDSFVYASLALLFLTGVLRLANHLAADTPAGSYHLWIGAKVLLVLAMLYFRVRRSSRLGARLARSAARVLDREPSEQAPELERLWSETRRLLIGEATTAIPVVLISVLVSESYG